MLCVNLIRDVGMIDEQDVWEAEIFANQSVEWLRRCPHNRRCPAAKIFKYVQALKFDRDRLKAELDRIREFPDEGR